MKKFKKTICLLMCVLFLTGCNSDSKGSSIEAQRNEELSTETSTEISTEENVSDEISEEIYEEIIINDGRANYEYTFNPYAIADIYVESYGEDFFEYYKGFCDAVLAGEDSFECPDYDTYWKILDAAYICLPITSDCLDMPEYGENNIVDGRCDIVYRYSVEEHQNNVREFINKVEEIITTNIQEGDTEFEKALNLYEYCVYTYVYDYEQFETGLVSGDKYPGGYRTIMDETGICQDLAVAYAYLLLQAGVDSDVVYGQNEETAHAWNIVRINNQYYYMDVASQISYMTNPLYFFCVTADEYAEISEFSLETHSICGSSNIDATVYDVSDEKYMELRECNFYEVNHDSRFIVYEGYIYEDISYDSEDCGEYFEGSVGF